MSNLRRIKSKFLVLFAALLLSACSTLIIRDDGQVSVSLAECDGVYFNIVVTQSGNSTTFAAKKVKGGELKMYVGEANLDYDKPIKVEIKAVGSGAQACGIGFPGSMVFNGKAEPDGFRQYKVDLNKFN